MRNPQEYSLSIQDKIKQAINEKHSLIAGKRKSLEIKNITFDPLPAADDYARQKDILNNRGSEGVNMYGSVTLRNNTTGEVVDHREKMKLAFVPSITNRHSFIINGKEYIVHNQLRLRPAVYTKLDRLAQPVADFNLSKGSNMSISYLPEKQRMEVKVDNKHMPLYTFLKDVYKTPDKELHKTFGDLHPIEAANYMPHRIKHLTKLHDALFHQPAGDLSTEELSTKIRGYLDKTEMDPETNRKTMGEPYAKVNKDVLLHAARDILGIYKGEKDPTYKDNLAFKSIHSTEDFLHERLTKPMPLSQMHMRIKTKTDNANKISETGLANTLNRNINKFFSESDLVNYPQQVNPMELMENAHRITPMGEGGLSDTNSLPMEARGLHLSQLGFLDPVRTPDNLKAGIDLRLSMFTYKDGNNLKIPVVDKNGKAHIVTHTDLFDKVCAIDTEPKQKNGLYRAYYKGKMIEVSKNRIQYYIPAKAMFTVSTASIPYLKNTQGQRNAMGAKMTTQALSLTHRELPLVDTDVSKIFGGYYTPKAPVNGTVSAIHPDYINVKDSKGTEHKVNIPNNVAMNYHSYLHVDPGVKVGDKVKSGQMLGENNFTVDGKLALGINANVAFMPYKGLNFEDGFVVSETGAKKFASQHIFQEVLEIPDDSVVTDVRKYLAYFPQKFNVKQLGQLENGTVKRGSIVHHGDPLILAMRKRNQSPEVMRAGKAAMRLASPFTDTAQIWTKDYPGTVIDVVHGKDFIKVAVKAEAPLVQSDKIANRYGGKGVVAAIVSDAEMPRYADGSIPDVLINPAAVPSRMNTGQIFETQASKVLAKEGRRLEYDNMNTRNTHKEVVAMLAKAKLKDTEDMFDPVTKKKIKDVYTGKQYFLKLAKQTEGNYSARAGGAYDIDLKPVKGGLEGSKSVGTLDMYALLSHNSRDLLREKSGITAEYNPEMWAAIYQGKPIPPPKVPFAFEKTMAMLRGLGVDVKKEGTLLKATPFTDKEIMAASNGEIKDAKMITDKPDPVTGLKYRPERGGIFDPHITGGLVGKEWSHIRLATPIVNTVFEKPIKALLNMKTKDFDAIVNGRQTMVIHGKTLTGGAAIKEALKGINVQKEVAKLELDLPVTNSLIKKDEIIKKLKYLKALDKNGYQAHEAYTLTVLPIIPPKFRPIYPKETGEIVTTDANHLYRDVININNMLGSPLMKALGEDSPQYQQRLSELHSSVKKLQGFDGAAKSIGAVDERAPTGFMDIIKGKGQPKYGYFQSKVMTKAQDLVGRATVSIDPKLGLDECLIPEPMAWTLYGPFVIGTLVKNGYSFVKAQEEIKNATMTARSAMLAEMQVRPVIINRAPTLHKFNMLAFTPKLTNDKSVHICPLVVKGYNLDQDGDTVVVHIPVMQASIQEAYRMFPSKNLFNPLTKAPMHAPDQEAIMGLHLITRPGQLKPVKTFRNLAEAKAAFARGEIAIDDKIKIEVMT